MTNELIPIRSLHDVRARCFGVRRIAHVAEQRKSRLTGSGGCRRRERKLPELRRQLLFCHVRATNAMDFFLACFHDEATFVALEAAVGAADAAARQTSRGCSFLTIKSQMHRSSLSLKKRISR